MLIIHPNDNSVAVNLELQLIYISNYKIFEHYSCWDPNTPALTQEIGTETHTFDFRDFFFRFLLHDFLSELDLRDLRHLLGL